MTTTEKAKVFDAWRKLLENVRDYLRGSPDSEIGRENLEGLIGTLLEFVEGEKDD